MSNRERPRHSNYVRYLEFVLGMALALVRDVPLYAVVATSTWLLLGRETFGPWSLAGVVLVVWIADVSIFHAVAWRYDHRRGSFRFRLFATSAAHVGSSVLAWGIAGGFTPRTVLVGLVAGTAYAVCGGLLDLRADRQLPSDPTERAAMHEEQMRFLLFGDGKNSDGMLPEGSAARRRAMREGLRS